MVMEQAAVLGQGQRGARKALFAPWWSRRDLGDVGERDGQRAKQATSPPPPAQHPAWRAATVCACSVLCTRAAAPQPQTSALLHPGETGVAKSKTDAAC
ncbi:unnamed protein product [Urochloa humidicola]